MHSATISWKPKLSFWGGKVSDQLSFSSRKMLIDKDFLFRLKSGVGKTVRRLTFFSDLLQ
jgi:hypothetical protein